MAGCARRFAKRLAAVGEPVDFLQAVKMLTLDAIGETVFGYDFGAIATVGQSPAAAAAEAAARGHGRASAVEVANAFQFLLDDVTDRQFKPTMWNSMYWLPTEQNRQNARHRHVLRSTVDTIVQDRLKRPAGGGQQADLLDGILAASGGAMPAQAVADNLLTMLFGGFDTTSIALTYALYLLAKHPRELAKLREEVDRLGEIGYGDMKQLPYCTKVVKETLRLFPPAPITARTTTADLDLNGVLVKEGTSVFIPIWYVHRDPSVFPDPERFDPARFDRELPHGSWIPFSDGVRNCVGYRFAMCEAVLSLAVLCQDLEWSLDPAYELRPANMGVVQAPRGGLPLTFAPRKR